MVDRLITADLGIIPSPLLHVRFYGWARFPSLHRYPTCPSLNITNILGNCNVKCSPSSVNEYSNWCDTFELVVDLSFSDRGANDAQSDDILVWTQLSSMVIVLSIIERMWYELTFCGSNFEYKSVKSLAKAITDSWEGST